MDQTPTIENLAEEFVNLLRVSHGHETEFIKTEKIAVSASGLPGSLIRFTIKYNENDRYIIEEEPSRENALKITESLINRLIKITGIPEDNIKYTLLKSMNEKKQLIKKQHQEKKHQRMNDTFKDFPTSEGHHSS